MKVKIPLLKGKSLWVSSPTPTNWSIMVNLRQLLAHCLAVADTSQFPFSMRSNPWLWVGYTQLSSPIVLPLAEGLANVAGTEDFSELVPLFILRAGMWGEVGDVGDLPSDVLGLAERFRGWATSSCDKQRREEMLSPKCCWHNDAQAKTAASAPMNS